MHAGRNPVDPRVAAPCINRQGRAADGNRSSNRLTFPAGMSGSPRTPPIYARTDFIVARDGKISTSYLFIAELA